jgi:hypothetical protein
MAKAKNNRVGDQCGSLISRFLATIRTLPQLKISDCNLQSSDKFRFCVFQEGGLGKGMRITPICPHFNMGHVVEDYREGGEGVGSKTTWQLRGKE